ncbi:hypothetical protein KC340_g7520 [Hortaea werneckii]|nr:hypothetical protein KC342_g7776 [Hortaea werneckii]KAI7097218.1 hypothetical protein KC339_g9833 [Hortaea werneckii]KAI7233325.1 hypothetical protein KC365_g6432 [Hortaea werneckii]KAI7320749.1 hypothetical protein KC340_g7520 [Hortaea werneckii]KAI7396902.1 hypothetical protein KC328_g5133 [Hortaea werneckii]
MAPRSRTGCLTCRQRKLKCSEERPVCAQCSKANRDCVPSSGITFRHQQNPSLNRGEESLKSFYGYKETFGEGVTWCQIPRDLKFVYTNNPYDDEDADADASVGGEVIKDPHMVSSLAELAQHAESVDDGRKNGVGYYEADATPGAYHGYATHGLEALSAVASSQDQYSYAPPPATMGQNEDVSQHSYSQVTPSPQQIGATPNQHQMDATPNQQHVDATPNQHGNLDFILNPASAGGMTPAEPNIDPQLNTGTPTHKEPQFSQHQTPQLQKQSPIHNHVRTSPYVSTLGRPRLHSEGSLVKQPAIDDPQLAFLLRDYSERAGTWMDLFDLNLFFATKVPVLAVRCPLLLYSCVALSAKSLARVNGRKPVMGGQITIGRQSRLEYWPGPALDTEGWVRKAREYYDLAVSLLRQALAGATRPPTSSLPEDASPQTVIAAQAAPLPTTDSDELVAATAILCVYEFLDASGSEWSRHLDGAKTLFEVAKDKMMPLAVPSSMADNFTYHLSGPVNQLSPAARLTQGRKAVFWNFSRQDMLSAFINNTSTRLDTSDLAMWRNAGLKLTPEGLVCPSNPDHPEYTPENAMPEDLICNALIWLLMKLVNFISAGDDLPEGISPLGLGVRQRELLEYWEGLDRQLRVWYEGLPDTFHSAAVRPAEVKGGIAEKWFPRPMCASIMQSYHFARIQLLHNKPHMSTAVPFSARDCALTGSHPSPGISLAARHASYASILQLSRSHAKEIVAIGVGRSDEGTRIHSVQPLWTAGLVLGISDDEEVSEETEGWRRSIISQLRGIERDMGWAAEYRVESLLDLWGLPPDWGIEDCDR